MNYIALLKAGFKQHRGNFIGIFVMIFLVSLSTGTILSLWTNAQSYMDSEIQRVGFGDFTTWVSDVPDTEALKDEISQVQNVKHVQVQNLIYSAYTANGKKSDSEGQLIPYSANENQYKFFTYDVAAYRKESPEIQPGEIYISPSTATTFDIQAGDEISFQIARQNENAVFTVMGYYENPFMGSTMIGMKGFLINETDYNNILQTINASGIDALARDGAMLHIFSDHSDSITVSDLNEKINHNTSLLKYVQFSYSKDAVSGFMLILQNVFNAFLLAFVLILLLALLVTLSHAIGSTIETDFVSMGILKTIGYTGRKLRFIQISEYMFSIISGMLLGILLSIPTSKLIALSMTNITGILIPVTIPVHLCILAFVIIAIVLCVFILMKTKHICHITPIEAIHGISGSGNYLHKAHVIHKKGLYLRLALRQLITGKRRYMNACICAILLVFFASLVGRMGVWLGPDGKGMMDVFTPADHDIGIQLFGTNAIKEAEETVLSYTDITESYTLAMPNVTINGIDTLANVISQPQRFHILKGKTCMADNEIVLTEFVASDLGLNVGDTVTVGTRDRNADFIISGIYQCANDMGNNVGLTREGYLKIGQDDPRLWCHHYFLDDNTQKQELIEVLENKYGGDIHVHENTWPGLDGIVKTMRILTIILYIMVTLFILIITIMTGSRVLAFEEKDFGIYKALGFQNKTLRFTFALRFGMASVVGSIIGTILALFFADPLVSYVMKFCGISNFGANPNLLLILLPAIIVSLLFVIFAYFAASKINKLSLTVLMTK